MPLIVAPPPAVLGQWSELVYLIQNVDAAAKLIADLTAAATEYNTNLQSLSVANSEAAASADKAAQQEVDLDAKLAALAALQAENDAKTQALAVSEGTLQSGFTNLQSRVDEFEVYARNKQQELDTLEGKLNTEMAEIDGLKASAAALQNELKDKLKAIQNVVGA